MKTACLWEHGQGTVTHTSDRIPSLTSPSTRRAPNIPFIMPIREDLVSSALTFLSDPKVQSSPLTKRLAFLESKGLTQEEITEVLNRANNPQATTPTPSTSPPLPQYAPYGNPYGQSPEPPARDWRDWFIMAVISSGVSYGLYFLAKVFSLRGLILMEEIYCTIDKTSHAFGVGGR